MLLIINRTKLLFHKVMITNYVSVAQNLKKVLGRLNLEFGIYREFLLIYTINFASVFYTQEWNNKLFMELANHV